MIEWPDRLITEIARRRCVLFLGAGVSRNSQTDAGERPPLWNEFLELALGRCDGKTTEIKKTLNAGDLLTACQLIKTRIGSHEWHDLLEKHFQTPIYKSASIHDYILKLDSLIVATSNVDKIYDRHVQTKYQGSVIVKRYTDEDIGRHIRSSPDKRLILKIHGCIDTPDKAIFTREDYANARARAASFYSLLDGLIFTNTFIFIGCGLSDPDMLLLLENSARAFRSTQPHYFVSSQKFSADYDTMLINNYNLKGIYYSSKDDHVELSQSLENLTELVDNRRSSIASTQLW